MGLRLGFFALAVLLTAPTTAAAEGTDGSGGSAGTRDSWPCSGCITQAPGSYDAARPTPLLVTFHGDEGDPDYIHSAWDGPAEDAGFLLVSLQCPRDLGCSGSWWRWEANSSSHDFAWVGEQVDRVEAEYNVELNQVYLAGFSGGSSYLSEYLPRFSERYAGAIYNGGGYEPYGVDCPSCDVPVHFVIGDNDFLLDGAMDLRSFYEGCGHEVDWQLVPRTSHTIVEDRLPGVLSSMAAGNHPCRAPAPPPPPPDAGRPDAGSGPPPGWDAGAGGDAGSREPPRDGGRSEPPPGPRDYAIVSDCSAGGRPAPAPRWLLALILALGLRRRARRVL